MTGCCAPATVAKVTIKTKTAHGRRRNAFIGTSLSEAGIVNFREAAAQRYFTRKPTPSTDLWDYGGRDKATFEFDPED
jgi:hypothetical protein